MGGVIGFLEAFVVSNTEVNTAPHAAWARELEAMGGKTVLVVHDYVEKNPYLREATVRSEYGEGRTLAIASHGGHPLERIEAEVEAASKFQGLLLLVTGPPSKLAGRLRDTPPNVRYLGLLPMDDYLRLKASCDFALNITDEPLTLSHVLFEYAASSLPVISTRNEVVEETFGEALLYAKSSAVEHVDEALRDFLEEPARVLDYKSRMERLFAELSASRKREIESLKNAVTRDYRNRGLGVRANQ